MSDNDDSHNSSSMLSHQNCQELRRKVTLTSPELIELTYHEDKFNTKLQLYNSTACTLIQDDHYEQAAVYLDQAERVLEYAAGCGQTIERSLITTVLNNQACLLHRSGEFQQSANYLEAIIFNITEFVEGYSGLHLKTQLTQPENLEFAEMATYFERKVALGLYHLRFCALTSHAKNNEAALKSARKALNLLKEVCQEESLYEAYIQTFKRPEGVWVKPTRSILKDLSSFRQIEVSDGQQIFGKYLKKAVSSISSYQKKIDSSLEYSSIFKEFQNFSIGNLMQSAPTPINSNPNHQQYIDAQLSQKCKIYKVLYLSMAHFTIATELRLISSHKYALDQEERRRSLQFQQSRLYHLLAITVLCRYLPSKSVFFDHSVSSFRNHYGIDLLQESLKSSGQVQDKDFSVLIHEEEIKVHGEEIKEEEKCGKGELSLLEEGNTYQEGNKSIQINQVENIRGNQLAFNMFTEEYVSPNRKTGPVIKELSNAKTDHPKLKHPKLKTLSQRKAGPSSSRVLEMKQTGQYKNKQNRSKSKLLQSKGKLTVRSKQKPAKPLEDEQQRKVVYYGYPDKSRSKSKRGSIERRHSRKDLAATATLAFENKKLNSEMRVNEEYGVRSSGQFGTADNKVIKFNNIRGSHRYEQQNIYFSKGNGRMGDGIKMKKLKSPTNKETTKRKSVSRDRPF